MLRLPGVFAPSPWYRPRQYIVRSRSLSESSHSSACSLSRAICASFFSRIGWKGPAGWPRFLGRGVNSTSLTQVETDVRHAQLAGDLDERPSLCSQLSRPRPLDVLAAVSHVAI